MRREAEEALCVRFAFLFPYSFFFLSLSPFIKEPDTKANLASLTSLSELTLLSSHHAVHCQFISKSVFMTNRHSL